MRISDWSSDVCSSDSARGGGMMRGCLGRVASLRSLLSTSQRNAVHKPLHHPPPSSTEADPINRVEAAPTAADGSERSEESRVGKGCVSTCRYRWEPQHKKKK